jgi:hypothetical protein
MDKRSSRPRVRGARAWSYLLRAGLALLLAGGLILAAGPLGVESAAPSPTPQPSATPPSPTATAEPDPTRAPTRVPTATPTATPTAVPAQDLAVVFFNNFCELGQPLMATVFNTSATPLNGRTLRLRLSGESGVLEEHDHYLNLEPQSSVNLPLANAAQPPWVKIEIELLESPADPNPANDSSSCGVPDPATPQPTAEATSTPAGRVPPISGGATSDSARRQTAPTQAPSTAAVQPTTRAARAQTNSPQPVLTPIGDAGGGLAPQAEGGLLASRTLMLTGVVLLAGGSSWAFYYLTRPPKNA